MKKLLILVMMFTMLFSVKTNLFTFAAVDTNAVNKKMLSSINQLRAEQGEQALTMDSSLISIANIRSQEASGKWSHTRPNGQQGADMIPADKWRGENLSYVTGTEDPAEAAEIMFKDLVASPTHYDNMVFDKFTKIGISSYVENGKITVAYMFSS